MEHFHPGFTNSTQVTQLIADTRAANCNALVVEVRRRGDAYYNSQYEPRAAGVEAGFDPLADLIAKGHDTSNGPRLEIHAWMTVYPVWRGADGAAPPGHPMLLHPDWLSCQVGGKSTMRRITTSIPAIRRSRNTCSMWRWTSSAVTTWTGLP